MLKSINVIQNNHVIFTEDFKLFFHFKSNCGNPIFKNHFVGNLLQLKETHNLKDIRGIINLEIKHKHSQKNFWFY